MLEIFVPVTLETAGSSGRAEKLHASRLGVMPAASAFAMRILYSCKLHHTSLTASVGTVSTTDHTSHQHLQSIWSVSSACDQSLARTSWSFGSLLPRYSPTRVARAMRLFPGPVPIGSAVRASRDSSSKEAISLVN